MTVYVALRSLGIKVDVLPVVIVDEETYLYEDEDEVAESEGFLGVITEEYKKEKAEKEARKEAERREAERSPERSAEYLDYKQLGRRAHVGAKLQPHIVADSNDVEEEGGLLAVSKPCHFELILTFSHLQLHAAGSLKYVKIQY